MRLLQLTARLMVQSGALGKDKDEALHSTHGIIGCQDSFGLLPESKPTA